MNLNQKHIDTCMRIIILYIVNKLNRNMNINIYVYQKHVDTYMRMIILYIINKLNINMNIKCILQANKYMYANESFLAVVKELVQLVGRGESLCPGVDQFQQVRPTLVYSVLPFSYSSGVRVAGADQLITDFVDRSDALLTDQLSVSRELTESITQQLHYSRL